MKVIKAFNDKVTRKRYNVGDTYSGDRERELEKKGFLKRERKSIFRSDDESGTTGPADNAEAQE